MRRDDVEIRSASSAAVRFLGSRGRGRSSYENDPESELRVDLSTLDVWAHCTQSDALT